MINFTVRAHEPAAFRALATSDSSLSSARSTSSHSLATEGSEAFSQALSKFGIDPSTVRLTVDDTSSQNNGSSQNSVSTSGNSATSNAASPVTSAAVTTTSSQPESSQPASTQPVSTQAASTQAAPAQQASAALSTAAQTPASTSQIALGNAADEAYDAAYWASQPAAVQQLQNIQDPAQRTELATQLASEGYTIDVPIMVWGWDPGTTMQLRESYGYTWVPSALQQPVTAAPGITGQGITPYEPNDPPPGSIAV